MSKKAKSHSCVFILAQEVVAQASEKKGTTKTQSFSGLAAPGKQKRLPLCLRAFVVQRFTPLVCQLIYPQSAPADDLLLFPLNGWTQQEA